MNMKMILLVLVVLVIGIGAGYYHLAHLMRLKHSNHLFKLLDYNLSGFLDIFLCLCF